MKSPNDERKEGMSTLENVIKNTRGILNELKKSLLAIVVEAVRSKQQNTNESLTIPKELALAIINDAKKIHEEASEYIRKLYYLKQLLISIKDLETIASRDIEIGTKCKVRVAIKFLDERKAEILSIAPIDKITGRISIAFNVKNENPARFSISKESAQFIVETLRSICGEPNHERHRVYPIPMS